MSTESLLRDNYGVLSILICSNVHSVTIIFCNLQIKHGETPHEAKIEIVGCVQNFTYLEFYGVHHGNMHHKIKTKGLACVET